MNTNRQGDRCSDRASSLSVQERLVLVILFILCIDVIHENKSIPGVGPMLPHRISLRLPEVG